MNMTSYMDFVVLLNDAEDFLEQQRHPEAEALIQKARNALEKDLGNKLNSVQQTRQDEVLAANQRSH